MDRVAVPSLGVTLSRPLPVIALVGRYLTNKLIGPRPLLKHPTKAELYCVWTFEIINYMKENTLFYLGFLVISSLICLAIATFWWFGLPLIA